MFPERLVEQIRCGLVDAGVRSPVRIRVERPLRPEHGDYASPVALRVGPASGRTSRELADLLAAWLRRIDGIAEVAAVGAGYLNVWLTSDGLAETARTLATDRPQRPAEQRNDETIAQLAMLLRGADALGVSTVEADLDDLAGTEQRHLICLLAETADLARRRPDQLARQVREIRAAWDRVQAVQPILPKGDAQPDARHGAGRLLAAATHNVLATYRSS